MRELIAIFGLLILFSCQSQHSEQKDVFKVKGVAKFEFQKEFHNFGDLEAGETVAFGFEFKNHGSAELLIDSVEADCGCILIEFPREEIKPMETAYIEVVFNSAGEVGRVFKTITIFSNAENKDLTLSIAANVNNKMLNLYSQN